MKPELGSMITAMVTPFTDASDQSQLDCEEARRLAASLVTQGSDGLVLCGSTGEGPTITPHERQRLVQNVIEEVAGRSPLIVNIGTNSTRTTVEAIREANEWAVDGFMVVVPYYNKPPQEGLYRHFAAAAEASEKPIVVYNIPSRTGVNLEASTTLRLAEDFSTIAAIKEASGLMDQIQTIIDGAPDDFVLYSGDDESALEIIRRGGAGVISTIGNIAPSPMGALVDAALAGDFEQAEDYQLKLVALMRGLFATTNPILVKEALRLRGLRSTALRLPLLTATPEQSSALKTLMDDVEESLIILE